MFTSMVVLWALLGLLLGILGFAMVKWLRSRDMKVTWYDWLIGIIGLAMLIFTFQNFYSSFMEDEAFAGWMFLLFPGLLAVVLMGIVALQIWRRNKIA